MKPSARWLSAELFSVIIGLTDGMSTALLLAGSQVLGHRPLDAGLALRVALVSGFGGALPLLAAEYARLRQDLSHAARELNLPAPQRLLRSRLGTASAWRALRTTAVATLSGFAGALVCLLIGAWTAPWAALLTANLAFFVMGGWLGRRFGGRPLVWGLAIALAADVLTVAGLFLHISG
ncbi:MAG: hypothetical protein AB7S55_06200 [Thiomonas sp.]